MFALFLYMCKSILTVYSCTRHEFRELIMTKKLFTLLLAVAASVGTMFASTKIGDLYYNLDATNQTAEVTSQNSSYPYWSTTITTAIIPASVTYNSATYSVTSIGYDAFYGCTGLTSVTIPNSVTYIGNYAFYKCTGLTSMTIPNSVTSIGSSAFSGCSGLTSVTIPNSVTSIGDYAFLGCTGLTSVTIPNSVTSIGDGAFSGCTGLTSVTIPNSVTSIGKYAFSSCSGLTSIIVENGNSFYDSRNNCNAIIEIATNTLIVGCMNTIIPNSVTSIGNNAFEGCSGLTSVTIPNSVKSIGGSAFTRCTGLTSVTIPNSVTSIGEKAFEGCTGLTSLTIPNSVTSIGDRAFEGCSGLTSVTIGNSVTSIGSGAFRDCILLQDINIPNSVTSFGGRGGTALYNTAIWNDSTNWENGVLYYDGWLIKAEQKNGFSFQSYEVPSFIRGIGGAAFKECSCLISVTIGNSVTSIGDGAFCKCSGLTSVTIKAETPPTLGSYAFDDTNNCRIYVPCSTLDAYKTAWSNYASQIKYAPAIDGITTYAANGHIDVTIYDNNTNVTICDGALFTLTATPDYGYHFSQWSDGNTDNPRTIVLTQDTTFTAEFAKNTYTISTTSANPEWGITAGGKSALYLDEVEISAIPNYGYHFVRWNDNNRSNPRTVSVTEDKTFIATFAKNVYSITKNAEHGTISGNSSAEYLDFVTLTVTPDYGYHFTQWSDGLKDNPRIAQITQDTTFTAEFAYDRVGTCGKDLALVWSYDPTNKVLTIGNAGSFTENMQFGLEAPNEMEELVIGNSVTAIGANAFAGISSLKKVSIGESVKTIGEQAFFNCVNLETIFNYRPTPTNTYSNAFDGVDKFECVLYVLPSSIDMYKAAAVWRDFYYTYAIGAEETTVTTNDVTVEPQNNAATVTWPTSENAASYTIQITKDGVLFCTLIFNANGQLIGIAFAPSRDGQAHAPAAIMTANGLQFTVTGLDSGTHYDLTLQAKDSQNAVLASYSSNFTTTGESQGFEDVQGNNVQCTKVVRDGQIFILRGEKVYNAQGALVK